MALLGLVNQLQSLWPFSWFRVDDLKLSDRLVRRLSIPDETKQFVFALREPESGALVYVLCAQNLSERSARDTELLIKEIRPDAVVVQAGAVLPDYMFHEHELGSGNGKDNLVPTSAYSVLMRSFVDKKSKDEYEGIAGSLVLKEIFGVGFYGHLLVAKRMSEEVGSSFFILEAPLVKPEVNQVDPPPQSGFDNYKFQALGFQPNGSALPSVGVGISSNSTRFFTANNIQLQMLKSLSSFLDLSLGPSLDRSVGYSEPRSDYQPPAFAESVYPLLIDLHDIFFDIPSMGRALACAQKMFDDVGRGQRVDAQVLSEVFTFQIAVEGLRVALNNSGRLPLSKKGNLGSDNMQFSELPVEEKSSCLLAQALHSQSKNFKTIVAVIDAGGLAGIRKYWHMPVPQEISGMIEELVVDDELNRGISNDAQRRVLLKDKPVVALGAGATAILGASSLSKVLPASSVVKIVTLNVPASLKLFLTHTHKATIVLSKILGLSKAVAPGLASSGAKTTTAWKAIVSAEKIRAVTHSMIASAERTSLSAMRTAFYEIMRKRQVRRVGFLPWATFGCSVATCAGLLAYGDGIECVAESLPVAPAIASLGRGIQNLQQTSQAVSQISRTKMQKAMESLMYRLKKMKIQ